jgi:hypothetical protein
VTDPAPHDDIDHDHPRPLPEHIARQLESVPVVTAEWWESFAIDDLTEEEAEAFLRAIRR